MIFIPGRRKWQPTPVLLPGKFHGWRSLVGYSPWGHKASEKTERLHFLSFCSFFWRRKWQPTPVFLHGESHGRKGLVGCGLWGWDCKESDTTKQHTHTHTHMYTCRLKKKKKCTMWVLWVKLYVGQNGDCSLGASTSDSSEKLLQISKGEGNCMCNFDEGVIHAIKHIFFLLKVSASHQEQSSPWRT